MRVLLLVIINIFVFNLIKAQINPRDSSVKAPLLAATVTGQFPYADMGKRFGYNTSVGAAFINKSKKGWIWGVDINFMFGNKIKEDSILNKIATHPDKNGNIYILSSEGKLTTPRMWERGIYSHFSFGKMLYKVGPNSNCGFFATFGIGGLYHHIRIEDIGNSSPQLSKDYRKGYDRLSYGISINQFVGYMFLHSRKYVNFFIGIEVIEGFTKNRRGFNYDTMLSDDATRTDILMGCKAGFIFPLYKKVPNQFYYY